MNPLRFIANADTARRLHAVGALEIVRPVELPKPRGPDIRWAPSALRLAFAERGPAPYLHVPFEWVRDDGTVYDKGFDRVRSPFGQPGDVAWVAEPWTLVRDIPGRPPEPIDPAPKADLRRMVSDLRVLYAASEAADDDTLLGRPWRWRAGATMPRWASRSMVRFTGHRLTSAGTGVWRWCVTATLQAEAPMCAPVSAPSTALPPDAPPPKDCRSCGFSPPFPGPAGCNALSGDPADPGDEDLHAFCIESGCNDNDGWPYPDNRIDCPRWMAR